MPRRWSLLLPGLALFAGMVAVAAPAPSAAPVVVLELRGAIGPATADYVHRGLAQARERNAALVVLATDTPGGLDTAMRRIIQDMLASPVPVAVYVSPSGARAASAGTYILYASHVAAMAPGTNLGSATPVKIGGVPDPGKTEPARDGKRPPDSGDDAMTRKVVNDAAAYIRGLAQMRGRNVEWAERAVREAVSLPAEDAVRAGVADLVARDLPELLQRVQGRRVSVLGQERVLNTAQAPIETIEPDWRTRLLTIITDPNVAYILMLLGFYGLFFELWNPGYVVPGVVGAICLLLALFAFQVLPVNYAGLGLILLGIAFMVAEAFVPSFGVLGIGGVIAFVVGSIMLIDTEAPGLGVSSWLIGGVALASAAFFLLVVSMALTARRKPVVSGAEEMIGARGIALDVFTGGASEYHGRARVHSEEWSARARAPVAAGQTLRVVARDGLILTVEPVDDTGSS